MISHGKSDKDFDLRITSASIGRIEIKKGEKPCFYPATGCYSDKIICSLKKENIGITLGCKDCPDYIPCPDFLKPFKLFFNPRSNRDLLRIN